MPHFCLSRPRYNTSASRVRRKLLCTTLHDMEGTSRWRQGCRCKGKSKCKLAVRPAMLRGNPVWGGDFCDTSCLPDRMSLTIVTLDQLCPEKQQLGTLPVPWRQQISRHSTNCDVSSRGEWQTFDSGRSANDTTLMTSRATR